MDLGEQHSEAADPIRESHPKVDPALRDALCHPKNRQSGKITVISDNCPVSQITRPSLTRLCPVPSLFAVLRLEHEVLTFLSSSEETHLFEGDMSSYDRLLTHRTAQHWGLETATINQGPDQGRILATKVAKADDESDEPPMKLADIQVSLIIPSQQNPNNPRLLTRRRPGHHPMDARMNMNHHHGAHSGAPRHYRSVEEREEHYQQARARIFGPDGTPQMMIAAPYGLHTAPQLVPRGMVPVPGAMQLPMGGALPTPSASVTQGQSYTNGRNSKAQMRNRSEDLNDPDFRRGRGNVGPRYDNHFEEGAHGGGGMYVRPAYSSEFPELGVAGNNSNATTTPTNNNNSSSNMPSPRNGPSQQSNSNNVAPYGMNPYLMPTTMYAPYGMVPAMMQTMQAYPMPYPPQGQPPAGYGMPPFMSPTAGYMAAQAAAAAAAAAGHQGGGASSRSPGDPVGGGTPTSGGPGQHMMMGPHYWGMPANVPPGAYPVPMMAGMYQAPQHSPHRAARRNSIGGKQQHSSSSKSSAATTPSTEMLATAAREESCGESGGMPDENVVEEKQRQQ